MSQHQAVIIATQSAQALLEKQGSHLTPEEKEKLQNNIEALKAQYDSALCDSERKMKVIQTVQEELEKFTSDCNEFENWLEDSKHELEHLGSGAEDFTGLVTKLQRQKSFSEDVISHKGDLRYITISGQRVLDAAKSCAKDDVVEDNNNISTMETCKMVQSKLDMASENFKSLHAKVFVFTIVSSFLPLVLSLFCAKVLYPIKIVSVKVLVKVYVRFSKIFYLKEVVS